MFLFNTNVSRKICQAAKGDPVKKSPIQQDRIYKKTRYISSNHKEYTSFTCIDFFRELFHQNRNERPLIF